MLSGEPVDTPRIVSDRIGGTVEKHHVVKLEVTNPDAAIFYTLDGTAPELYKMAPKVRHFLNYAVACMFLF